MWQPTISSDELYHHGIEGMHWGQRNGPPYPLNPSTDYSAEEKKNRKSARQERHEEKKQRKREKKAIKAEQKRQKILKEGSLKDVRKLKGNISNEEYQEVFRRLENEEKLDDFDKRKKVNAATKIKAAKSVVSDVNATTDAALKLYNRGAAVYNVIAKKKGWQPQDLPIIKVEAEKKDKKKKDKDEDEED